MSHLHTKIGEILAHFKNFLTVVITLNLSVLIRYGPPNSSFQKYELKPNSPSNVSLKCSKNWTQFLAVILDIFVTYCIFSACVLPCSSSTSFSNSNNNNTFTIYTFQFDLWGTYIWCLTRPDLYFDQCTTD